jgi:transposase-like protein
MRTLGRYREVQELLHRRGIVVSHETLREWCIKFGPLFTEDLRHREPRRGSRWHLDEVCTSVDDVRHWLWRAMDEHHFVLDILLQRHRDTEAAKTFLTRLLGEYDVPEVIDTDQLRSYGAAIREIPSLVNVDHQQVISAARCNNVIEQRASVVIGAVMPKTRTPIHTTTRAIPARIQTAETRSRIPELTCPDHQPPPSFPHQCFRRFPKKQPERSVPDVVNRRGRGGLKFRPPLPLTCRDAN